MPKSNIIKFNKFEVGPAKFHCDNKVLDEKFTVSLYFEDND